MMAKALKKKQHGGKRPGSGPRVSEEDLKKQISMSFKSKLLDSPEKVFKLKKAIYQYVSEVYEAQLK